MKRSKFLLFVSAVCSLALLSASGNERPEKCLFAVVPALGGPTWEPIVIRVDKFLPLPRWFEHGEMLSITQLWEALKASGIRINLDPALSKRITLDTERLKVSGTDMGEILFSTPKRAFEIYREYPANGFLATIFSYQQTVSQYFGMNIHFEPIAAGTHLTRRSVGGLGRNDTFNVTDWIMVASADDEVSKFAQSSAAALGRRLPDKEQSVIKEWQKLFDSKFPSEFEVLSYDKSMNLLFVRAPLKLMEAFVVELGPG